ANALTWTWYLLAQNPEAGSKLRGEASAVLGDRLPRVEDLERLPFARRVLAESMRLFPPAWILGRQALEEVEVGGHRIPRRATVFMSPYVLQRTARWFPDPERFDPERWAPEAAAARPPCSYIPFGGGPRGCIGESFAWLEGVVALTVLGREWNLRLPPGHRAELQPIFTLRPRGGMPMVLERRGACG